MAWDRSPGSPCQPRYTFFAGIGRDYYTIEALEHDAAGHRCPSSEVSLGAGGFLFDCSDEGFESLRWLVAPQESRTLDPAAGLLASMDIKVFPDSDPGPLYDEARMLEIMDALSDAIRREVLRMNAPIDQ